MKPKHVDSPRPQPNPLPRPESTDHATTPHSVLTYPTVDEPQKPSPKPLPRLGPTDHMTIAHNVPTNLKYERGPDGKQLPEPVTVVPHEDKGKGKAGM